MAKKVYDIFLSHDFEDKSAIADELSLKLREAGFNVWYSGTDLKAGDDLEEAILKKVIPFSTYTIALISSNYVKSEWTRKEYNAAANLETKQRKIVIPVLFNISFEEVAIAFPAQKLRFAIKVENIDKTVRQLVKACKTNSLQKNPRKTNPKKPIPNISDSGILSLSGNVTINGKNAAGRDILINPKNTK